MGYWRFLILRVMNISITFYNEKGNFRDKADIGRAFKDQLGPKSISSNTSIKLKYLRDRIDLRWKKQLERIISSSRQFKAIRAKVYIEHPNVKTEYENMRVCSFNFRNPKKLSNDIANYILLITKNSGHGISHEQIKKMAKK